MTDSWYKYYTSHPQRCSEKGKVLEVQEATEPTLQQTQYARLGTGRKGGAKSL